MGKYNSVGKCTSRLALSDTCASASDVTCSVFDLNFVLFIDNFLFKCLNILQQ